MRHTGHTLLYLLQRRVVVQTLLCHTGVLSVLGLAS
jgi:hypothetical protein